MRRKKDRPKGSATRVRRRGKQGSADAKERTSPLQVTSNSLERVAMIVRSSSNNMSGTAAHEDLGVRKYTVAPVVPTPKALLQGAVRCSIHSYAMHVSYGHKTRDAHLYYTYWCHGEKFTGGPRCFSVSGPAVDRAVAQFLIDELQPPRLELVRAEWKRADAEGNSAERMLRFELERARVAAEQAEARYDSVDLENKLVKARLEKRLQEALAELKQLERRVRSGLASADPVFTDEAWTELLALSQDIAGILSAPTTGHRDRKELFRTLWDCAVLEKQAGVTAAAVAVKSAPKESP